MAALAAGPIYLVVNVAVNALEVLIWVISHGRSARALCRRQFRWVPSGKHIMFEAKRVMPCMD